MVSHTRIRFTEAQRRWLMWCIGFQTKFEIWRTDMPDTDEQGRTYTEQLEQALEQACHDLHQAHNELMKAQGATHKEALQMRFPEWSPQANTIRWAEKILGTDLRKSDFMLTPSED